jgi:hypothetical protein
LLQRQDRTIISASHTVQRRNNALRQTLPAY